MWLKILLSNKILTGRELLDFQSDLYHMNKKGKIRKNKIINKSIRDE